MIKTSAGSEALRLYAKSIREANLMASPKRETFLTGLTISMDKLADSFDLIDNSTIEEIRQRNLESCNSSLAECYPSLDKEYL